jgi:hypothetical protein
MGNSYSNINCDICIQCNKEGMCNDNLEIIKIYTEALIIRCSKCHVFKYSGNAKHIEYQRKRMYNKIDYNIIQNKNKNDNLQKENFGLRRANKHLKKNFNNNKKNNNQLIPFAASSAPFEQLESNILIDSSNIEIVTAKIIS